MEEGSQYGYDSIGNRVWSVENAVTNTYTANSLNQYTAVTPSLAVAYDADGNMTRLGDWYHTWDGENRLTQSQPVGIATNGAVRLNYHYNHRNLQIAKITERLSGRGVGYPMDPSQPGTWDAVETRRYVWDGYNIAAEIVIDEVTPSTNVTYYTWGLDLSGTLQGAGGVGGLLAETRTTSIGTNTYYALGEANGNVTEYADATGAVRGHYGYSPFGEITAQSGDLADTFTHRFSTKPFDVETKLVMYELRPYDPGFGRWLTKDPIGEIGGVNIYVNSGNNCVMNYDCFGLSFVDWLPFAGTLKTIIENMARAIPGQDANNYPASVTLRRCCEAGDAITETECEQINNDMFYQYSRDFSVDAFKGKVLEVVAVVIIKNPAISLAALVDGLTAGINWVDVLNDMRKARDAANEKNCDCSKTGYIP